MNPELLKMLMGMQGGRPQSLTPNSLMGNSGGGQPMPMSMAMGSPPMTQNPQQPNEGKWSDYLGVGAGAISPIAAALLGRQRQSGAQLPGGSVSLGSKPMMGVQNPYPQQQLMPQFLSRLLMGGR